MDPATLTTVAKVVGTGVSLFGAYNQYEAGRDAAKLAKDESNEQIRRQQAQDRARLAESRARAAASGINLSGSTSDYLSAMEREQGRELNWLRKSGKARAEAFKDEGASSALGGLTKAAGYWT